MYTAWTKHLSDPEQKKDFERHVLSAKPVLEVLLRQIKDEERALSRSETDIKSFDQPNWDYKQAYKNGYRASLEVLKKLIDLDQQQIITQEH